MHVVRLAPCSAGWLLRTTMSSRRFPWFPLLVPKKFKAKGTKSKVSNIDCANFFEDQLRPGTSWEWSRDRLGNERVYLSGGPSFGDGGGEKIDSYLANSLTHIFIHPGTAWKRCSDCLGNDGEYFWGGTRYSGDEFKGSGERIDS